MTRKTIDVEVDNTGNTENLTIPCGSSVGDLLMLMGLLREEYIALKEGRVVYEFEILTQGDKIKLIRAFSGG